LTSSVNPAVFGQPVTFTASVSAAVPGTGAPTGTVTFSDGITTLGTATLSMGAATWTTTTLPLAGHGIIVVYDGDTNFTVSVAALAQAINSNPQTTLTSSLNPSLFGQPVTFTATVTAVAPATGTPTGTVTFRDGTTSLGTVMLNASGIATLTTTTLSVGGHWI